MTKSLKTAFGFQNPSIIKVNFRPGEKLPSPFCFYTNDSDVNAKGPFLAYNLFVPGHLGDHLFGHPHGILSHICTRNAIYEQVGILFLAM